MIFSHKYNNPSTNVQSLCLNFQYFTVHIYTVLNSADMCTILYSTLPPSKIAKKNKT